MQPRQPLQLRRKQGRVDFSALELITLGLAFLIAAVVGYEVYARESGLNAPPPAGSQSGYIPAFERTLSTTIAASGTVQSTQSVALSFGSAGKIAELNVKAGDQVVAGQQLAALETTQLQSALRSAQTNLATAQSKLDAALNPSAADKAAAWQAVLNAQNQIATAKKNLDDLLAKPTAEDLASAQQAVNQAMNGVQSATDAIAKAQKDLTDAQNALGQADQDMRNAYSSLSTAHAELQTAERACAGAPPTPPLPNRGQRADPAPFIPASVTCASLTAYTAASSKYGSAASTYNSSITNYESKQTAVRNAENTISSGNLERSLQSAQLTLETARAKQITTAGGATNLEISNARNSVSAAESALLTAQKKYDDLISPGRDILLPLQASVDQAAENVATAQDNLKAATIIAPFDGTVSAVSGTVGGQATATTAVVTLINPKLIRIDANVDQSDVASLRPGQSATATFDALPGTTYRATVSTVGVTPTTQSGVVTYVVSFAVDTSALPPGTAIPAPGMTASLTVTTATAPNALVVPARSIRGSGANATVTVRGPNGDEQRRVTTGLSNGTLTQITSGLERGEEVLYTVTATSTTSSTTTQRTTTQQFGGNTVPGGGTFPGGGGQIPIR